MAQEVPGTWTSLEPGAACILPVVMELSCVCPQNLRFGEGFYMSQDLFSQIAKCPNPGKVRCELLRTETVYALSTDGAKSRCCSALDPAGWCPATALGWDQTSSLCNSVCNQNVGSDEDCSN